ncbi:TonB family protein [bacterium SCSIO 12643]|nr:TonB family protein [bacterium SCSIO 12643]
MKYLVAFILISLSVGLSAQDTTTVYLKHDFSKTSQKKAFYYQKKVKVNKEVSYSEIYTMKGVMYQKGYYQNKDSKIRDGQFETFYSDGSLHQTGKYLNNIQVGLWTIYYPTGEKKSYGNYNAEGEKDSIWISLHQNGKVKSTGQYLNGNRLGEWIGFFDDGDKEYTKHYNEEGKLHGTYVFYGSEKLVYDTGAYENGDKIGEWKYYFNSGKPSGVVVYEQGEAVSATYWNEDGKEVNPKKQVVNQEPVFPGGESEMYAFLGKNLRYPPDARDSDIQGRLYASFIIDENGEIIDIKILRGLCPSIDHEAIRVIKSMPNWLPGISENRKTRVKYNLPIVFKLS